MELDFENLITTIQLSDAQRTQLSDLWMQVFTLVDNDEDFVWRERLEHTLGRLRVLVDDTNNGSVLFGHSAAHIFQTNQGLDAQMTNFQNRFIQDNADARQAYNDSLGLLGHQGN